MRIDQGPKGVGERLNVDPTKVTRAPIRKCPNKGVAERRVVPQDLRLDLIKADCEMWGLLGVAKRKRGRLHALF